MLRSTSWIKIDDQDLNKNVENKTEIHYLSIKTKISTKHKEHFEIHSKFKP
jgi:hypothetical protein